MKDILTIKEVAEITERTTQSIYKRIAKEDNPIQAYIVMEEDQIMLKKEVLSEIYNIQIEGVELTTSKPSLKVDKPEAEEQQKAKEHKEKTTNNQSGNAVETASSKVIEILREQLQSQREEIQQKNKIIADLNERLADSQRMLDQQQRLSMADKQQILMLEGKKNNRKGIVSKFISFFKGEEESNNDN